MGRAIVLPDSNRTLDANPKMTFRKAPYTYTIETHDHKSVYSVTDGTRTISSPVYWSFGAGVQAWLFERDGKFYESLVSYYPAINGLDVTVGDEGLTVHGLEEAFGRELTEPVVKDCFGCHATNAVSNGKLNLQAAEPGVGCEHCHAGSTAHLAAAFEGSFDVAPPDLRKLSSEDISSFCGRCHRTWETVVRNRWRGEPNVRFAPYRLAKSKCFDGSDPRISCLACHNPHQDVVRQAADYDSKCLACHASAPSVQSTSASAPGMARPGMARSGMARPAMAKSCPVATADCVSCHMPKVKLPDEHLIFTDHWIRIAHAGDPYPD